MESHSREAEYGGFVGASPPVMRLFEFIDKAATTRAPVLITGESGTGKEMIARAIHDKTGPPGAPLVIVDCATLSPSLIESELFGYRRGAFTGAEQDRKGLLELANGGSVFLDEVSELPASGQARLLRFLQEGEIRPVGSTHLKQLSVRVIAASNRYLRPAASAGNFRWDLYYRLAVFSVEVPPLRKRMDDLGLLVKHFVAKHCPREGQSVTLSPASLAVLKAHLWPGNVRELENCIQRALLQIGSEAVIDVEHITYERTETSEQVLAEDGPIRTLAELERIAILQAMIATRGDALLAARLLGIGKTTLYRKLKEYRLQDRHLVAGT